LLTAKWESENPSEGLVKRYDTNTVTNITAQRFIKNLNLVNSFFKVHDNILVGQNICK